MMMKIFNLFAFLLIYVSSICFAAELVDEDFDDQAYSSPLRIYNWTAPGYDTGIVYQTGRGGTGYAVHLEYNNDSNTSDGSELSFILNSMQNYLADGIYFRYWVKYDADFMFPKEVDSEQLDNFKLSKIAGDSGWDMEFIWKNTGGGVGPTGLQMVWNISDGSFTGGSGTGNYTIFSGDTDYCGQSSMSKDCWHKVEIYVKIDTTSVVHVTIDDVEVHEDTDADVRLPTSNYTGTQQFYSIWAGTMPADGYGDTWVDDIYIAYGEGDLTGGEPDPEATPTISGCTIGNVQ